MIMIIIIDATSFVKFAKIGQEIMVGKALYAASFANDGLKTG